MELKWKLHKYQFEWEQYTETPATPQRFCLMDVHRGTLVKHVTARVAEEFQNMTSLEVGDNDDDAGFGAITNTAALYNLNGVYIATEDTGGGTGTPTTGKLYTQNDTIELVVTPSGAQSAGLLEITIVYAEVE